MKIYKYYKCTEHSFENLTDNKICFNFIGNFNDPNEGKFVMISKTKEATNLFEESLNNARRVLSDNIGQSYTEAIRFKIRVFSSTDSAFYNYMWDEYADYGKGFCVEYDSQDLQNYATNFNSVNYIDDFKKPNGVFEESMSKEDLKSKIDELLYAKYLHPGSENNKKVYYENEHEIRYIKVVDEEDIEIIKKDEYLNKTCKDNETIKRDKFVYYCDLIKGTYYRLPKLYFAKVKASKIYVGQNIDAGNFSLLEGYSREMSIPLILISQEELI